MTHAPRSWMVEYGSRKCQIGPTIADSAATPTHPNAHRKSVEISAELDPPMTPWARIHSQATSPTARRPIRIAAGGR